jgi:two-component system, OmpR family, response regulator VicR
MAYKILVVDDEKDIVNCVCSRLQREGYEVSAAFDGEEALFKVEEADPDAIILDLSMPKLNGFEVLKALRQKTDAKWRPVIIVSANEELESVKKSYSLEADHYLTKPCSMENLLRGVQTVLSLIPLRIK